MAITVSVLMSICNESEKQIMESVESILNQSFQSIEFVIVCDNPSREKEMDSILNTYRDSRMLFLQNEKNVGLAMSMNRAAEVAKSDVFARMDADDIAKPNRLEEEYKALLKNKVDVVFTNFTYIDEQSADIKDKHHSFPSNLNGIVPSIEIALRPNLIHHPTVMMRREMFEKVGGYRDFPCAQDADLWMRMQEAGALFFLLDKPLMKYRINPNSTTAKQFFKQQLTAHYIYKLSLDRLQNDKDNFSVVAYNRYLEEAGIGSQKEENRFKRGISYLRKAKQTKFPINVIFRMLAFSVCKQLRSNYNNKKLKQKLLGV